MTSKRFVGASLSVAAALSQATCSADRAATPVPETSAQAVNSSPTSASTGTVVLPEGTLLAVRTSGALSTNSSEAGQTFSATLEQPVLQDGREVVLKGARVEGKILDADKGGRIKGVAGITVQLTGLEISGQFIYISTNSVTLNANTTKRKDAAKIGVGAGVGAVIGAIAGGGESAAIGAAAGGAAGTGVVLATHGDAAVIPDESVLHFELSAPVTVAAVQIGSKPKR